MDETFLVQLRNDVGPDALAQVQRQIRAWNGEVLLRLPAGRSLIVRMESSLREALAGLRGVALVGGVQVQARSLKRIRVKRPLEAVNPPGRR